MTPVSLLGRLRSVFSPSLDLGSGPELPAGRGGPPEVRVGLVRKSRLQETTEVYVLNLHPLRNF